MDELNRENGELPAGWAWAKLSEVTEPSRSRTDPQSRPTTPYVGLEHIEARTTKRLGSIPASSMKSSSTCFHPGDVLYGRLRSYLNKVWCADFAGLCSAEFIVLSPSDAVDGKYLTYRLNASDFVSFAEHQNEGDRPRVDFDQIGVFQFTIPPFDEQRRIVDKIEELFTDLGAGVEALRRVQKNLERYRASVLKAAVEGRLTEQWRAGRERHVRLGKATPVEPAIALLKRILSERRCHWEQEQLAKFARTGRTPPKGWQSRYPEPLPPDITNLPALPAGWCWTNIDQCSVLIQYGTSHKTSDDAESGVPVLRMGNITLAGQLDLSILKYLPADHEEFPNLLLAQGDLLFNRTNSAELVGKTAQYAGQPAPCSFASYLIRVQCVNGVRPTYLAACINSGFGRQWIKRVVSQTAGQANVNGTKLAAFTFPLPTLPEQEAITAAVEEAESIIDVTLRSVGQRLAQAAKLRQAILKRAFDGKLVAQDTADEPADVLLARIQLERKAIADKAVRHKQRQADQRKLPKGIRFRQAAIAAYAINRLCDRAQFGRTQLEKVLCLTQHGLGVDLSFEFKRKAAGPFDEAIFKIESLARKQRWFDTFKRGDQGAYYRRGCNIPVQLERARTILGERKQRMDLLLDWLSKMDTEQAELLATVFAAWNDLLINRRSPSDDDIIREVYGWHESKHRFEPERITKCIRWLKGHDFAPTGVGPRTLVADEK